MAGSGAFFRLFVILLGLSHLICLKAVPITRSENLVQSPDQVHLIVENNHKVGREKNRGRLVPTGNERVDFQLDYASPGANNHHTPRSPYP